MLYSRDIQPQTGNKTCVACHKGLALGTYPVDSTVNASTLRRMLVSYGQATGQPLAQFDAWVAAGRPETETGGSPPGSAPVPGNPPVPGTPPVPDTPPAPVPPQPPTKPVRPGVPAPPATPAPGNGGGASVLYSRDIQPITGSQSCLGCHQGGSAPKLALGTYPVDSKVSAATMRGMIVQYGQVGSQALVNFDAWVAAGRPQTEITAPISPNPGTPPNPGVPVPPGGDGDGDDGDDDDDDD